MKYLLLFFVFSCSFICCQDSTEPPSSNTGHPNIIYILADDLGYGDLSCYGQQKFATPHIDRLAQEGMLFTQHYSGATVCAPSRSALMTGLHTGHTYVRGNKEVQPEGQWPLPDATYTLSDLLKERGYVTGIFGKWGLGYPGSTGAPENQGFDVFYGYNCQRLAHNYYPEYLWNNTEKEFLPENDSGASLAYAPFRIQDQALEFLNKYRDTTFFLYYPTPIPHAELLIPDSLILPFKGLYNPEKTYEGVDSGPQFRKGPYGSQEMAHAAFAAMVTLLDNQVGELMQAVKDLGLENNTIVIFTSDNGPHLEGGADPEYFNSNGPLRGYKRDVYEGGVRVPMLVRWPEKIEAGQKNDHVSAFWDVLPTVADILQVKIPVATDGISFLPSLLGDEQPRHDYLYWEFHELGGRRALRQSSWKLVQYNVNDTTDNRFELYDVSKDTGETKNLASMYPDTLDRLKEIMLNARVPSSVFRFSTDAPEMMD